MLGASDRPQHFSPTDSLLGLNKDQANGRGFNFWSREVDDDISSVWLEA
jgi:hypothetical protein